MRRVTSIVGGAIVGLLALGLFLVTSASVTATGSSAPGAQTTATAGAGGGAGGGAATTATAGAGGAGGAAATTTAGGQAALPNTGSSSDMTMVALIAAAGLVLLGLMVLAIRPREQNDTQA